MSRYDALRKYVSAQNGDTFKLSYEEIEKITGHPLDHSFLNFKKELLPFGWQVKKISMKEETVLFERAGKQ
ncbi:MAG: hypothetical protein Q4E35_02040 [Eubacteriales bacterium]|nr:hypothetical protein [Eubacteriales bacterium]